MSNLRVISYSELAATHCPLKHQLSYIERWSKPPEPMTPLGKGTAWHIVMEEHYRELRRQQQRALELNENLDQIKALNACKAAAGRQISTTVYNTSPDLADLIHWMYEGYTAQWGADSRWRVLAVEHAAQCRLPTPSGRPSNFVLKLKIDVIVEDLIGGTRNNRQIWVVDHKSCRNLPKDKELELDDQFGLYTWALRKMGKKVFGQLHNAARTERLVGEAKAWSEATDYTPGDVQALDTRFKRTPMYRTDVELSTVAIEAYLTAKNRYDQQRQVEKMGVDSPRRTDPNSCRFICDYTDPCLAGRKGVDLRGFLQDKGFMQDFTRH